MSYFLQTHAAVGLNQPIGRWGGHLGLANHMPSFSPSIHHFVQKGERLLYLDQVTFGCARNVTAPSSSSFLFIPSMSLWSFWFRDSVISPFAFSFLIQYFFFLISTLRLEMSLICTSSAKYFVFLTFLAKTILFILSVFGHSCPGHSCPGLNRKPSSHLMSWNNSSNIHSVPSHL